MADLINEVINQRDPYQSQTVATMRGRARPPMMAPPVNLPRVKAFERQQVLADRTAGPEATARDEAAGAMALPRTIRPGYTPTQQLVSDATEFTGLPQLARGIGHIREAASLPTIDPRGSEEIGAAIGDIAPLGLAFIPMGEELGAGLPRMRPARPPVSETMFANSNTHMPPQERMRWLRGIVEDANQQQTAAEGINDLANGEYHFRRVAHANAEMDHIRTQIGQPTRARQIVMAERRGTIENLVHGQDEPMAPAEPRNITPRALPDGGVAAGGRLPQRRAQAPDAGQSAEWRFRAENAGSDAANFNRDPESLDARLGLPEAPGQYASTGWTTGVTQGNENALYVWAHDVAGTRGRNPLDGPFDNIDDAQRAASQIRAQGRFEHITVGRPNPVAPDGGQAAGGRMQVQGTPGGEVLYEWPDGSLNISRHGTVDLTNGTGRTRSEGNVGTGAEAIRTFRPAIRALQQDMATGTRDAYYFRPETQRQFELYQALLTQHPPEGFEVQISPRVSNTRSPFFGRGAAQEESLPPAIILRRTQSPPTQGALARPQAPDGGQAAGGRFTLMPGGSAAERNYQIPTAEGDVTLNIKRGADGRHTVEWSRDQRRPAGQRVAAGLSSIRGVRDALLHDAQTFSPQGYTMRAITPAHARLYDALAAKLTAEAGYSPTIATRMRRALSEALPNLIESGAVERLPLQGEDLENFAWQRDFNRNLIRPTRPRPTPPTQGQAAGGAGHAPASDPALPRRRSAPPHPRRS